MNYKEFKSYLSKDKREADPFVSKKFYRPVSLLLGWQLYRLGMTANSISILSILIAFFSCSFFISGDQSLSLFGSIFILIVGITDCIDGNIARASKQLSSRGAWLDALSSYLIAAFLPISLGIYAFQNYNYFYFSGDWLILGSLMSINNILIRLVFQKFSNLILSNSSNKSLLINKNQSTWSLSAEIGLVGWMAPLLILCTFFDCLYFYLVFYTVFYSLALIYIIFRLYNRL